MPGLIDTLASYVPWQIAPQLLTAHLGPTTRPFAERFPASILFVDISGFTPLVERLTRRGQDGVEELSRLLNTYFGELIDLIVLHGGVIVKFAGDSVTALWPATDGGLPTATREAIQCGFALQTKLNDYSVGEGVRLYLKINVEAGEVVAAHIGGYSGQWALLVAGEPFARLGAGQQNIQPGNVVVSSATLALAGEHYVGRKIGDDYFRLREPQVEITPTQRLPAEIPPLPESTLRAYIPRVVLSRLDAGQSEWLAELRRVTVLFIAVSGLDYTDPNVLDKLQSVMTATQTSLSYYEGTLIGIADDDKGTTIIVAFGLPPLTHEDDTLRGVQAAQDIQTNLHTYGIASAIGITTGRMFCGPIGNTRRREYTLYGNEMNIAARLMQAARLVGENIFADEATYQSAKGRLQFEKLPAFVVKGKTAPIGVYRLGEQTSKAGKRSLLLDFQAERAALMGSLETLRNQADSVILLEGEPGIGKSRLLQDLLESAQALGVRYLMSEAEAIERSTPYYAWRTVFSQLLGVDELREAPERRTRLLAKFQDDPEVLRLAPLLNTLLPLDLPENEVTAKITGLVRADNLNWLLLRLLQNEAQHTSLLIVLEDAHWLDSASWALALRIAQEVHPVLLAVSLRPLADPIPAEYLQLIQKPQTKRLMLDLLGPEDSRALVCQHLGISSVSDDIADLFQEKAGGNPFFIEELGYALRDRGIIIVDKGVGQITPDAGNLERLDIPDTIHGIVTSRIDQLEPSQQMILKVASVIGRVFPFQPLYDNYPIPEDRPHLRKHLSTLERLDIVRLETPEPDLAYSFKHATTQHAAYNLMLSEQRRKLHQAVAAWYEHTYANHLVPYFQLLAYHWHEAAVVPKAVEYFEKAGEQALNSFANEEACQFLEQTIRLDAAAGSTGDKSRRARRELKLGEAYVNLGNYVEGRAHLEKGLALLGYPIPTTLASQVVSLVSQLLRQVCHRLWPTRFLGRLPDQREGLVAACRAYERLVEVYYFGGEMPLSMYSAVCLLNLAEAAGSLPGMAVGSSLLGAIFGFIPLRSTAEAYLHRALESVQKFDDIEARLLTLIGVGYYYAGVGNWERFRAAFDEIVRISMQFGHRRRLVDGFNSLMYLRLFKGEFPSAGQLADTLRESVKHLHDPRYRVFALAGEAYSHMHAGKFDEALSLLEEAHHILATHAEIGDKDQKIEISGLLSIAHLRRAEFDQARELAQQATSLTSKASPSAFHTFSGYAGPAEVYLTLWEAQYPLPSLANLAAKACKILNRFARIFPIGKPRFWLSQGRYYWLSGKPSQARKAWQKGLTIATQLAMPYEQALAHYEIGRHLEENDPDRQQHLGRAGEILIQCGENYYRVLVQELLASAKRHEDSRS